MIYLSSLMLGFLVSSVLVGVLAHYLLQRRDEVYLDRLDNQRRADRDSRELSIKALRDALTFKHEETIRGYQSALDQMRDRLSAAEADANGSASFISRLRAELDSTARTLDATNERLARVSGKARGWKRDRRLDRRRRVSDRDAAMSAVTR